MSARPIVTAGIAGALLAGGLAALAPERASSAIACFNLVPDIVAFARSAPSSPVCGCVLPAIAGGVIAALFSVLALGRNNNPPARFALLVSNPLLLLAFVKGAETSLLLAAMMIVASAAFALAASRDYRAAVLVGLALAGAPFLSNSLLYLYPALLFALPLVSPWGLAPRRLAGFSVVVWSPFSMALIGLAYLHWLIGDFGAALAAPPPLKEVFCPDYLALTASAALMAFAARGRGLARPLGAFILGGAIVAASQTGMLAALH
ncbi:MAG: hypothetical protein H6848_00625 [Caulobacterales bacterium]|nr:hypothetical protein [Caulobacterales bacterium]